MGPRQRRTLRKFAEARSGGRVSHTLEDLMAGYGLFVLILAVGTATVGYYWMRND